MQKTVQDQLSTITITLLLQEPFFGHFFSAMLKRVSTKVETISLSLTDEYLLQLDINSGFWLQESAASATRLGWIKHELLHLIFKHTSYFQKAENKTIFNIAADLVVNQYLSEAELSDQALTLSTFPDLELKAFQDVQYYYECLIKLWREDQYLTSGSREQLQQLLLHKDINLKKHQSWEQFFLGFTSPQIKILNRMIDAQVEHAKQRSGVQSWGQLPGNLPMILEAFSKKPAKITWKSALRLFIASSGNSTLKDTIHRPSKRYKMPPGLKISRKKKLLIVLDTSGSISASQVQSFFQEIHQIWKQGHEVIVLECDTAIQVVYPYKGEFPDKIQGRGGTNYDAALEWANQHYLADGIIYFTDAYGPKLKTKSRRPMLWVIARHTKDQDNVFLQHLPGRKVSI